MWAFREPFVMWKKKWFLNSGIHILMTSLSEYWWDMIRFSPLERLLWVIWLYNCKTRVWEGQYYFNCFICFNVSWLCRDQDVDLQKTYLLHRVLGPHWITIKYYSTGIKVLDHFGCIKCFVSIHYWKSKLMSHFQVLFY